MKDPICNQTCVVTLNSEVLFNNFGIFNPFVDCALGMTCNYINRSQTKCNNFPTFHILIKN